MKFSKIISIIFKLIAAVIVAVYIVFAFIAFANVDQDMQCTELNINFTEVQDSYLLTKEDIKSILEQNKLYPEGKIYFNCKIDSIERFLRSNPMITTAECYKTLSGKIELNISQKQPKFVVVSGKNTYYVDNNRDTVPYSLNFQARLPVVTGDIVYPEMASESIYDFVDYVQKDEFWNAQIAQIDVVNMAGSEPKIELITRVGDAVIHVGTLDDFENKLQKMYSMYKDGFSLIGWNNYDRINLEYDGQIVCRKKQKTKK